MRNEDSGEHVDGYPAATDGGGSTAVGEMFGAGVTEEVGVAPTGGRSGRAALRRRRRRRGAVAIVVVLALLVTAGFAVVGVLRPLFEGGQEPAVQAADFPGPGHGSVQVVVSPGDTGAAIGETLETAGVVASATAFENAYIANPDAVSIQPGTYELLLEMRAGDAVNALLDRSRRVALGVTVPEGLTAAQTLERVSAETSVPLADLQAAAADPAAIGLPPEAGGNIEGWLFPATYEFEPGVDANTILSQMVAKTVSVLDALGVPPAERQTLLTKASLVEREGRTAEDRAKIAQAIQNRLDMGMKLDIDAALAYGLGKPGTGLTNTDKESDSPYNLYRVEGLPPGPIAAPSEESIAAVLNPTPGPWLYWVTVNLDTGETLFADNLAEHNANVQLLRAWQAANE